MEYTTPQSRRQKEWNIRYLNHAGKRNGLYNISITQAKGKGIYDISITQAKEDDKVTETLEPLIELVTSEALFFRPQVVYNLLYVLS